MQNTTTGPNPTDVTIAVAAAAFFRGAATRAAERRAEERRGIERAAADRRADARAAVTQRAAKLEAAAEAAWDELEETDTAAPEYAAALRRVSEAEAEWRHAIETADQLRP